ncbi:hypothetical protein P7C70_g2175, partial [Phenoliferia sp. Uapishka_3]
MASSTTPKKTGILADFDPLATPTPTADTSTPLSFKRRQPSRSISTRTGLLGNILSRSNEDEDRVPTPILQRPDAPLRDPTAFSDDDDEPPPSRGVTPAQSQGGRWPQKLRAASGASRAMRSGGANNGPGMRSPGIPGKWDQSQYSQPGARQRLLSPTGMSGRGGGGGGDDDEEEQEQVAEVTPLPTLPILVLCIAMFGAVGVARSAVQSITDPSNESRAFTFMGLSWGLGGIVGSVIGGLAENPVRNHPAFFGDSVLFTEYPYLLPCLISGSVTLFGSLLSLFLNEDGGPRDRGIQLPTEKDVERVASSALSFPGRAVRTILACVSSRHPSVPAPIAPDRVALHRSSSTPAREEADLPPQVPKAGQYGSAFNGFNPLSLRRTSTRASGSAYGYSDRRFPSVRRNTGRSMAGRSVATTTRYAPDYEDLEQGELNFAQRILLANEPAVFSLSDLWVSQATRADEQFSQAYTESVFEDDEDDYAESRIGIDEAGDEPDWFGFGSAPPSIAPSTEDLRATARQQDEDRGRQDGLEVPRPSSPSLTVPSDASPNRERVLSRDRDSRAFSYGTRADRYRRGSMASSAARGPALFANTGLDPSSLGAAAPPPSLTSRGSGTETPTPGESTFNPMAAIPEQRAPSIIEVEAGISMDEKPSGSIIRQLPLAMIAQYAVVALHGTTCDQVFLSFLVTPIASGGLGLKAAHYAGLVATMFFFQTLWQFRFYPFISAPRGPLSHLAMFRLGLALYLPVYFLFPELRGLLKADGNNVPVMFGMTLLSSIRYLASTCAYTAVMVLINAMTPPHLVPLANGLAQSAVSLARFIGKLSKYHFAAQSLPSFPLQVPCSAERCGLQAFATGQTPILILSTTQLDSLLSAIH